MINTPLVGTVKIELKNKIKKFLLNFLKHQTIYIVEGEIAVSKLHIHFSIAKQKPFFERHILLSTNYKEQNS